MMIDCQKIAVLMGFIGSLCFGQLQAAPTKALFLPQKYEAQYKVYWHGLHVGNSYHKSHKADLQNYRIEVLTKALYGIPYSLFEQSEYRYDKGHVVSETYQYNFKEGLKRKKGEIEFNTSTRGYSGRINGKTVEATDIPDLLDNLNFLTQLQYFLSQNKESALNKSYEIFDKGKVRTYRFELSESEPLITAIGKLNTVKLSYHTPDGKRTTSFWLACDKHYFPIKMVQKKLNRIISHAEIETVKFFP